MSQNFVLVAQGQLGSGVARTRMSLPYRWKPMSDPAPPARPPNSPWVRPSTRVLSEPEVFADAPTTAHAHAYAWLHEDLHRLHLDRSRSQPARTELP